MKPEPNSPTEGQRSAALFDDLPVPAEGAAAPADAPQGRARVQTAQRNQIELRACDLDALLAPGHAARTVWAFVQSLDLAPLYARIKAVEGRAGRAAIDPAILVGLWLYATIDGVGSARELNRLCERDDAYRWLCGGVGVNYHSLADFRTEHAAWLDAQLTRSVAALLDRGLVQLNRVAQDGMRVRAHAKAASFRRRDRLARLLAEARAQVERLKQELHDDPAASSRRQQAARERAAREREQRLARALATLDELDKVQTKKGWTDKRKAAPPPDDEPPGSAPQPAQGKPAQAERAPRVSTTDSQARVMKMADGGFRPAFNAQLAVDADTQIIAALELTNAGTDMQQMAPMHTQLRNRYGRTPAQWLADGGFAKLEHITALSAAGTEPYVPVPASRNPTIDPHLPKDGDSAAVARWRARMGTADAAEIYKARAASVECANAQLRRRGLHRFNVCGTVKARAILLWHALAHNLMRVAALEAAAAH